MLDEHVYYLGAVQNITVGETKDTSKEFLMLLFFKYLVSRKA